MICAVQPGEVIKVRQKKSREVVLRAGKIFWVGVRFIIVDFGSYKESFDRIELMRGEVKILHKGKVLNFGKLIDVKKAEKRGVIAMMKLTMEGLQAKVQNGKSLDDIVAEGYSKNTVQTLASRCGLYNKYEKQQASKEEKQVKSKREVTRYERHMELCRILNNTYRNKNLTYDNAFGKTFQELGIVSAITRMADKWNRIKALTLGTENKVKDEVLEDTLKDMANYCLMTLIELERKNENDK